MDRNKFRFITFFKTYRVVELADLVATKIERSESYYIHKSRPSSIHKSYRPSTIITKQEFEELLSTAKCPIILSDEYIDLDMEIDIYDGIMEESIDLQMVRLNPDIIRSIGNPSEEVQLTAVESFGMVIRFIKTPSIDVQLAAIKNCPFALCVIDKPDPSVVEYARSELKKRGY